MSAAPATGAISRARAALRSRDFRALLGARLISQFADGLFQAYLVDRLVFLAPEDQGTASGLAIAFVLLIVPFSLLGPVAGVFIDRWSRRRILVWTPLVRGVVVMALVPLASTDVPLYVVALVVLSANRFFLTCAGAVVPKLVPEEDLLMANAVASSSGTFVSFVGILVGTQVAGPIGPEGIVVACAMAWVVSGVAAARIRDPLLAPRAGGSLRGDLATLMVETRRGFWRLRATPQALGPVVSVSIDQFLIGLMTVLSVVVFKEQFQEGIASYGRIVAAGGAGILVGSLTVGWFEPRLERARIVALAFAIAGVVCLGASPWLTTPLILLVSFTLGLTYPWRKIPSDTLVQEAIPDRYRGRVFALYDISFSMARVASGGVAVLAIPRLSSAALVALAGAVYLAWSPVVPWWVRRPQRVEVRFYAGGRAEEVPRAVVIAGEEQPVELVRSRLEERGGARVRSFRVRTGDGEHLDLAGDGGRWNVERRR